MKIIYSQNNQYVLKLDRGEELVAMIKQFCATNGITGGFFVGLGATSYLKMAWYNLETKKYEEKEYDETLEIANLTGNIAFLANDLIIHVHGSFSNRNLDAIAGHVSQLVVGGACEIKFDKFDAKFSRAYDEQTGLNLLT